MFSNLEKLDNKLFDNGFWPALAVSAGIALAAFLLIKLVNRAVKGISLRGNSRLNASSLTYFRRVVAVAIGLLALYGIFMQVKPLQSIARSLLASSGVLVVILGFAGQQAMANIVGGLFITMFRPFSLQDRIRLIDQNVVGFVEDISLRHTVIRTFENNRIIVPNSIMNAAIIENTYYQEDKVCKFLEIGISLDSDTERAMGIMAQEVRAHKNFYDNRSDEEKAVNVPEVSVKLVRLSRIEATLRAAVWARNAGVSYDMSCDLLFSIKKRFEEEGIQFPPRVLTEQ